MFFRCFLFFIDGGDALAGAGGVEDAVDAVVGAVPYRSLAAVGGGVAEEDGGARARVEVHFSAIAQDIVGGDGVGGEVPEFYAEVALGEVFIEDDAGVGGGFGNLEQRGSLNGQKTRIKRLLPTKII